jgi:hypothetical protein
MQRALWRRLATCGFRHYPAVALSDQVAYRRRDREAQLPGPTPLARLFARVTAALALRLAPFANATRPPSRPRCCGRPRRTSAVAVPLTSARHVSPMALSHPLLHLISWSQWDLGVGGAA